MKDINLMALDLELNQPSGSIIQVGAVVGNLKSGKILQSLTCHIKINEEINPFITKLTSVTQKDIDTGISLELAYNNLINLYENNGCNARGCTLTWGTGDMECFRKALGLEYYKTKPLPNTFYFGRRFIDVKTVFISYQWAQEQTHQAGLARALVKLGMSFDGKKHNAEDDAKNTFLIYRELLNRIK